MTGQGSVTNPGLSSGALRIQLFGRVTAWRGAQQIAVGPVRQRALLAVLALAAGRPVPCNELIAALWSERPPIHAVNLLHTYVMRLRQSLDPGRALRQSSTVLPRAGDGYVLQVGVDQVDMLRFRQLHAQARSARRNRDHDQVTRLAEEALKVSQMPPLADVALLADHPRVVGIANELCGPTILLAEAALQRGNPREALTAIEEAAAARPLDESVHAWLIRLYHAAGQRADALAAYDRIRRRLAKDLGMDPMQQLRELHTVVLRNDEVTETASQPDPVVRPPTGTAGRTDLPHPRALPRDLTDFTGREKILRYLLEAIPAPDQPVIAPVVVTIDGMPGVGKTALAIRLAHLVADRYSDAHLYLDLRGHSVDAPLQPASALDTLLRQLGIAGERIPDRLDERITLWRTELAARRVLLLLDNASGSDQVTPLLPAEPGCVTLITSRRRLVGLDAARPASLDVLTTDEAVALQHRIVGRRVEADFPAAEDVTRCCGHLPLAIRLAAARLAHRPGWTVPDLAERLRDTQAPLSELATESRTVEAAFALSYDQLAPAAQLLFRRLSLHQGPDIDTSAAAALADLDLRNTNDLLSELVDAHLVEEPAAGRYQLHDLLREYASQLVAADSDDDRGAAVIRLLDVYLHTGVAATEFLEPGNTVPFNYDLGETPRYARPPADRAAALSWFAAERSNLLGAIQLAADRGHHRHTLRLTRTVWRDLHYHGLDDACLHTHRLAIEAARHIGDDHGLAISHDNVAGMHYRRGRWDKARHHLDQAIAIWTELAHWAQLATSLTNRGVMLHAAGRYQEALYCHQEALRLKLAHPEMGERLLCSSYPDIGQLHAHLGDYRAAEANYRLHLDLAAKLGSAGERGLGLAHLGELRLRQGRPDRARELLTEAVQEGILVVEEPRLSAVATLWLGRAHRDLGEVQQALSCHLQAVSMTRESGTLFDECTARMELAATLRALTRHEDALEQYRQALDVARQLCLEERIAEATQGIAAVNLDREPREVTTPA